MNYVLRMRGAQHRRLAALLRAAMPAESVAFLLCRRAQSDDGVVLLVDEVIEVEASAYAARADDIASVQPWEMARIAQLARANNRVIVMAHLHPMTTTGVGFSRADHVGNAKSFRFFHLRVHQPEHLALVWNASVDECVGLVYREDGSSASLTSAVTVDEDQWTEFCDRPTRTDGRYARQAMLLGAEGQARFSKLKIAVIGVGGLGSLASMGLVQHGVRHLVLIDDDVVEETNLPRLVDSTPSDIGVTSKVELAKRYALRFAPTMTVTALKQNVEAETARSTLIGCDVIVVCTDNTTSRAYVNQLGQQYLIPVLDLGVQFAVGKAGDITNEVARINLALPGRPCLWCSGHIDPARLAAEAVPAEERAQVGSYLRGMDDPQPSMLAFNMEVVARGLQVLLGFITGVMPADCHAYEQRTFTRPRAGSYVRTVRKAFRDGCLICSVVAHGNDAQSTITKRAT